MCISVQTLRKARLGRDLGVVHVVVKQLARSLLGGTVVLWLVLQLELDVVDAGLPCMFITVLYPVVAAFDGTSYVWFIRLDQCYQLILIFR